MKQGEARLGRAAVTQSAAMPITPIKVFVRRAVHDLLVAHPTPLVLTVSNHEHIVVDA